MRVLLRCRIQCLSRIVALDLSPAPIIVVCVALVACFAATLPASRARGATADQRPPNILFLIADDWGWRHAGAYGCNWVKTPTFDRMAREGVLFRNCFTSNPKCSPCRASILTGRNTWQLEEACCHNGLFPAKFPVYPDLLEKAGYLVGCTGKGWGPGDWKAGGFKRNPAGPEYNGAKLDPPLKEVPKRDLAKNFANFLKERKPDQPFCFWLGTTERIARMSATLAFALGRIRPTLLCQAISQTTMSCAAICSITRWKSSGETTSSAARSRRSKPPASSITR